MKPHEKCIKESKKRCWCMADFADQEQLKEDNWKTLRKTFEEEAKLARIALKSSVKYTNYASAMEYDFEISTLSWILKQMDELEEPNNV